MNRSTLTRTGVAGAIAGLGLTMGGIAIASADTGTATQSSSSSSSSSTAQRPGPGRHQDQLATTLATELGIKRATVVTALDAVMKDLRPAKATATDGTRTPPTDAERAAFQKKLATALAKKLNVSEAKVTAALEVAQKAIDAQRAERKTEARAELVTRLDAAVTAGTLTEADKTSVLKAFDADLLGGGRGPGGHGGPGGPGTAPSTSSSSTTS